MHLSNFFSKQIIPKAFFSMQIHKFASAMRALLPVKKRIPEIIYGICLVLKVYSIINFSELRNSIAPAFREVYGRKWIVGEAAFEIMSLLALWLLLGTEYPCCGMAIGSAVYFGRIAGTNAAAEE